MLPLFLAVLANVIGLGVLLPLLPFYAGAEGATPQQIAWLFAVFPLAQFATAPFWGRLSDRVGRKPMIALSFAGTAASYAWLAHADSLAAMFAARILAGLMNGWLATSQAYVADVTTPEGRAKGMGVIGAAFGVGFVIGPALGGYLVGDATPDFRLPILISAGASGLACAVALIGLREPARHRDPAEESVSFRRLFSAAPVLAVLFLLYFSVFFVFSGMETTFALFCDKVLGMGPRQVGYYLSFAGICAAVVQGWLVGRMAGWIGEARTVVLAIAVLAAGLALLPTASEPPMLLPAIALLATGFGLANPSLLSQTSRAAPSALRGGTLGLGQSVSSLARILGPAWGGFAFAQIGPAWPFLSGAMLLVPVLLVALVLARRFSRPA